jgi:hypothetical protein
LPGVVVLLCSGWPKAVVCDDDAFLAILRQVVDGWKQVTRRVREAGVWRQQQCCVLRCLHAAVQLEVQAGWWAGGLLMLG